MHRLNIFTLIALPDWWPLTAAIPFALGLMKVVQMLWASALAHSLRTNKILRAENTRLIREAEVRIDDLKDCWEQIDGYVQQLATQRETAKKLLESGEREKRHGQ